MPGVAVPAPGMRRPTVVVTRPRDDARPWVDALQSHGWPAVSLPLIDIGPPSSADAQAGLATARGRWWTFDALMFVSAAAVRHFFAGAHAPPQPGEVRTRFWAPGPGTARELGRALGLLGVPADRIDAPPADAAQFDSEHLWPQVRDQMAPGRCLLVVRGGDADTNEGNDGTPAGQGREWLMARCRERGALVTACMAYERRPPDAGAALREQVMGHLGPGAVWLFTSSQALANLRQLLPAFDAGATAALATHPRIASAAQAAGFAPVITSRPAPADVLAALESGWS